MATRDIAEGEVLLSVPLDYTLTLDNSFISKIIPKLKEFPDWLGLVAALLYEHDLGTISRWHSYLQILPRSSDALVHWSDSELQELQASAVLQKIGKEDADAQFKNLLLPLLKEHAQAFDDLRGIIQDSQSESNLLCLLHSMATLVMSYSFDVTDFAALGDGSENSGGSSDFEEMQSLKCMVPFADLLNADGNRHNVSSPSWP